MIEIKLSLLQEGQIVDSEVFDENGDTLLHKGTTVSKKQLEDFKSKNIQRVFVNASFNDTELEKILTTEFKTIEDLDPDITIENNSIPNIISESIPDLKSIKSGKAGFFQLLENEHLNLLEKIIKDGFFDKPVGVPLKNRLQVLKHEERKESDNLQLMEKYEQALQKVIALLNTLAEGRQVSMEMIKYLAGQIVSLFLTDRFFLLNLSINKTSNSDYDYIYCHSLNVSILSVNIATSCGYNEQQVTEIAMSALLHDIGMLLIPEGIRYKRERVTEEEWYEVQKHPILGLHILEKVDRLPQVIPIATYQTHERENGKGYPKQRSSRLIHPYAKIIAVADVFEALSSSRSYRNANIPYRAMELIIKMTRQGLLAGEYVKALLEYTSLFPIGSFVELSNGLIGKVVQPNEKSFAKPAVCILFDRIGNILPKDKQYIEDLTKNVSIQIIKAHSTDIENIDIMSGF